MSTRKHLKGLDDDGWKISHKLAMVWGSHSEAAAENSTIPERNDDTVSPLGVGWLLFRESKPAHSNENVGRGGAALAANRPSKRTIKN
jgi:hypothetical protein